MNTTSVGAGSRVGAVRAALLACVVLVGCSAEDLPGDYWTVTVTGSENLCTGNGIGYSEQFDYRLEIDGNDVAVAIGEDVWATGVLDGCNLSYTSLAWSSYRNDLEIAWQIVGASKINVGGQGCVDEQDWEGTETFVITESAHPDVPPGCTYTLDVVGQYQRKVE